MTREQLDKLIEGGGWLPIEEAPRDGCFIYAWYKKGKSDSAEIPAVVFYHQSFEKFVPCEWEIVRNYEQAVDEFGQSNASAVMEWSEELNHYMPLNTPALLCAEIKKLREANEVMREKLTRIAFVYDDGADMLAKEALAKVQEIMGGDDEPENKPPVFSETHTQPVPEEYEVNDAAQISVFSVFDGKRGVDILPSEECVVINGRRYILAEDEIKIKSAKGCNGEVEITLGYEDNGEDTHVPIVRAAKNEPIEKEE